QVEGDHVGLADALKLAADLGDERVGRKSRVLAFLERLQQHNLEGAVRLGEAVEKAVTDDAADVGYALGLHEGFFHPLRNLDRPMDRGPPGNLDLHEERTLVFAGEEAGRRDLAEVPDAADDNGQHNETHDGDAHEDRHDGGVAVARVVDGL